MKTIVEEVKLPLDERESAAMKELVKETELKPEQVLRQALRLYQAVHIARREGRLKSGDFDRILGFDPPVGLPCPE